MKNFFSRALYNGLVAGLQRQMAFSAIRIGAYDAVKQKYSDITGCMLDILIILEISLNKLFSVCLWVKKGGWLTVVMASDQNIFTQVGSATPGSGKPPQKSQCLCLLSKTISSGWVIKFLGQDCLASYLLRVRCMLGSG